MPQREHAKKSFDSAIKGLANPKHISDLQDRKSSIVLARFIRRTLQQFHLGQVEFYDVVHEVYVRGTKLIASGEDIKNPGAWTRVTAYNVIREMSRKQQKEQANSELIESQVAPDNCEETKEIELNILKQSLQDLSEKDRQILELRFFQNLTWKQVVTHLASSEEILTEATARQRGNRAVRRLKKLFLSIKTNKLSA
ncbi:MAG: sigma-70 family RNA polymerase sigma factor [Xenococcus sp. MO_188.B8]|nr:sigma-70 family RNA polymerase sigma factor [Xenococcus sp. MO_188.B8]